MSDLFDLSRGADPSFDERAFLQKLSPEERKQYFETNRAIGFSAPTDEGVLTEAGQGFAQNIVSAGAGLGASLQELTGSSAIKDYFQGVLNRNQQWNAPEDMGIASYIGRAVGSGIGSTVGTLGAATLGSLVSPGVGTAAGLTAGFMQTFGDNVQRNRKAGYSEDKALGMAFLESGVDTLIENGLGVVGKGTKMAANFGRLQKISAAGKGKLLQQIGKRMVSDLGKDKAQNLLVKWAINSLKTGGEESLEEGLQYINSYLNQLIGGDPNAKFSFDELKENMMQGGIAGTFMGGVQSLPGIRHESQMRKMQNTPEVAQTAETQTADNAGFNTLMDEVIRGTGAELGIKVDYIDNYTGNKAQEVSDGFYDPETDTIYLDRNDAANDPGLALGHEIKHFIDRHFPELARGFDDLWKSGQTGDGKVYFKQLLEELGVPENEMPQEMGAEVFGMIFNRPGTMKAYAEALNKQNPGMGEKFIQTILQFFEAIKKRLAGNASPEAETLFNNVSALEIEAGNILAEIRRRNGTSSQVENVVGAKGNTNVETVPVSQINVDAQRFQFKSNTSKASGVDESNKLGGDWDPRTAGNLYLWEDKNGNVYVVNGHHRLELAQRNNVENINAIIDRESDGVTAEQARRNGVLINIRDGQGEIRDYASFVRSENLTEDEAEAQGVTARKKGRAGFLLGKAGDTLYDAYRNEVIPESKAVIIAEVAQGNEAIEYAGIKLATDRKLAGETLRQTLKLAAQNSSGTKVNTEQGGLFDMVDDSVLQEWEAIGKIAAKHIKEIRTRIEAAKDAIKNPEAAKSLGVKTTKGAEKLLAQAQQELARWENYATDAELMEQLRNEAGIAPQEVVSEKESVAEAAPVVSAENAQTTKEETVSKKESVEPVVKENLTTEKAGEETAPEENTGDEEFFKDRTAELGFSFDEFYKNFKPSLESIIAKARQKFSNTLGSDIEAEWESAANKALVRAYMKYPATGGKAKLKTYASWVVANAITDVNRKHKANFNATGGNISLDQTNEQREALSEAVADENANALPQDEKTISYHDEPQKAVRKILDLELNEVDRKIVDLIYEKDLPTSLVIRKLGKHFGENGNEYMTPEEYKLHLKSIADQAFDAGLRFMRKRGDALRKSIQKRDESLAKVANLDMHKEISKVVESGIPEGKFVFRNQGEKQKIIDGAVKFLRAFSKKVVNLSDGRIAYFMPDERAFERGSATAWAEYGIHAVTSSGKQIPGKEYNERLFNQNKLDNLDRIIPIIQQENVFGKFDKKNPAKDGVIFVGTSHDGKRLEVITRLDEYGNPQADLTEVTVVEKNPRKNIPPLMPLTEVVEAVARHQEAGYSLSTNDNIPQSGKKSSENLEFMRKRLHQQINPIVVDGVVRQEYQDLLENKEYTPERMKDWGERAMEWIVSHGGIVPAAKEFLKNHAPAEKHVAALARRMIMNSDAFIAGLDAKERTALYDMEIDERSSWGKQGRALQLAALRLEDIASVQALLNKLHKDMPPQDLQKLRNDIKKDMDLDIYDLPKNIVNDKAKLDAVLRAHLAHKANFANKIYEYWINAILSGPATHVSNFFGNTANAAYELGIKRFTEALVNTVAGRKDGATFGEFKSMMKAFNWANAWKAAKQAFDLEVLDSEGKFNENHSIAIGGKTGRAVRVPGRLLKAADAFAKAIIQPVEVAAYAHRMGIQQGLTGTKLEEYIQKQLTDRNSKAYQWGNNRAKELSFQEDPGDVINRLVAMRESPGVMGAILKIILPFIKTPANILRQGARKSPLGIVSLAYDTAVRLKNKQGFDGAYIARVAEQIVAFGTVMAFASMGDDDDLPFITGSSAQYGSAEHGFKANKVPPYSIRIGDAWYSYQRIEPLSTGLALIADGIQAFRNAKNGKDGSAVMSDLMRSAKQIAVEKSFLDSFGELNKALDDPQHLAKALTNPVRGFIPNVYTQVRQALDENAQDNKSREKGAEWLKEQFFLVTNRAGVTTALPKIDYFGREVKKDDWGDALFSPIGRLLPLKRIEADSNFDKAEQLIWNFNQKHPNEAWYPSIPQNTFTVNKQRKYLTGEDYQNFAIDAGKLAHKQINNAIRHGYLNVKNPGEKDIELIKKIFARARKEARIKYQSKAKSR